MSLWIWWPELQAMHNDSELFGHFGQNCRPFIMTLRNFGHFLFGGKKKYQPRIVTLSCLGHFGFGGQNCSPFGMTLSYLEQFGFGGGQNCRPCIVTLSYLGHFGQNCRPCIMTLRY